MITEITMHTAYCDNCGKQWDNGDGIIALTDTSSLTDQLPDTGWHTEERKEFLNKHYCPECFKGFDDNDKIILKEITLTVNSAKIENYTAYKAIFDVTIE